MDADLPFVQGRPERFGISPMRERIMNQTEEPNRSTGVVSTGMQKKAICVIGGRAGLPRSSYYRVLLLLRRFSPRKSSVRQSPQAAFSH